MAINNGPLQKKEELRVIVGFGRGNVLVISPFLVQVIELSTLRKLGLEPNDFDAIAIKSRVHFRRGFDDSGFAKTILLVEPEASFLGTVRLDGLSYENVDLQKFYPYGQPVSRSHGSSGPQVRHSRA
jgi:microcystin degradation protein MlrC